MYPSESPRAVGAKLVSIDPLRQASAGMGASEERRPGTTWMLVGVVGLLGFTMWMMTREPV
jgi:hypothetical protein